MLTTDVGQNAEKYVAEHLRKQGHKILARNWKTKVCEIDIVAREEEIIYFIEVKYRSNTAQGEGIEYITPTKLRRLRFAAEIWIQQNDWEGDWRLLAAAVSSSGGIEMVEI